MTLMKRSRISVAGIAALGLLTQFAPAKLAVHVQHGRHTPQFPTERDYADLSTLLSNLSGEYWIVVAKSQGIGPELYTRAWADFSSIMCVTSGGMATYMAPPGHIWQVREALKHAAREVHSDLYLEPWPLGCKNKPTHWY